MINDGTKVIPYLVPGLAFHLFVHRQIDFPTFTGYEVEDLQTDQLAQR